MNVLKLNPGGMALVASDDSPVPRINRKRNGCTSEVTARSRSVLNLINSRRQTTLTARRSCRSPRSGTDTLIDSTTADSAVGVIVWVAMDSPPSAEPHYHLAHCVGARCLR